MFRRLKTIAIAVVSSTQTWQPPGSLQFLKVEPWRQFKQLPDVGFNPLWYAANGMVDCLPDAGSVPVAKRRLRVTYSWLVHMTMIMLTARCVHWYLIEVSDQAIS